ncbi:hypothetical protein MMC26_003300 [Xylographa opegraphella]|nr:hypothetical protein [Xylographa opegraphella]
MCEGRAKLRKHAGQLPSAVRYEETKDPSIGRSAFRCRRWRRWDQLDVPIPKTVFAEEKSSAIWTVEGPDSTQPIPAIELAPAARSRGAEESKLSRWVGLRFKFDAVCLRDIGQLGHIIKSVLIRHFDPCKPDFQSVKHEIQVPQVTRIRWANLGEERLEQADIDSHSIFRVEDEACLLADSLGDSKQSHMQYRAFVLVDLDWRLVLATETCTTVAGKAFFPGLYNRNLEQIPIYDLTDLTGKPFEGKGPGPNKGT